MSGRVTYIYMVVNTGEIFFYRDEFCMIERDGVAPYYKNRVDINTMLKHNIISHIGIL